MSTTTPNRCPLSVTHGTLDERLEYFKAKLTSHQHQRAAYQAAIDAVNRITGPRVVIVTGPTGVGKTTLVRQMTKSAIERYAEEAHRDRGFIPVLATSAVPPTGRRFNWKDFYVRLLTGHGDVITDRKLLVPRQGEIFSDVAIASPLDRSEPAALRRALEESLKRRRTKLLIIDEAHHLLMVKDAEDLEYQFETLKSLTIETDVTIVLVGTYRLLDIRDQSGQLVRRSEIVHLPRYDARDKPEAAAFAAFATAIAHHLPLEAAPSFNSENLDYLYTKTAGCVGILKDWFAKCLETAIKAGKRTITVDDLDKLALDNKSLRTIIEEAMTGESKLRDEAYDGIKALLRDGIPALTEPTETPPRGSRGRRVGQRRPRRDPVGGVRSVAP